MKKLLTFTLLLIATCVYSQKAFRYNGKEILTGKHNIYVNPKIKSKPKAYIYNNVNDALRCAEKLQQKRMANDTTWTCIYIEPSVYWIDNPNDTTIHTALYFQIYIVMDILLMVGIHKKQAEQRLL